MIKQQLIDMLNETGNSDDEVFMRGNNSFIIPITDIITMDKGEICLIEGNSEISVQKTLEDLEKTDL
jgi:membrane protease subunit (stomatin/prohibitin family)